MGLSAMPRDFFPRREVDVLNWTARFREGIAAGPGEFGLSLEQVAEYEAVQESFAARYRTANEPATRTPVAVVAKNTALQALEALTRRLAGIVRSRPEVSDTARVSLGLPARPRRRQVRPPVEEAPLVRTEPTGGGVVRVRLIERGSGRARRPVNAAGARVYGFVGESPPAEGSAWRMMGQTSSAETRVSFGAAWPPGTKMWFFARWVDGRARAGPASEAMYAHLTAGGPGVVGGGARDSIPFARRGAGAKVDGERDAERAAAA